MTKKKLLIQACEHLKVLVSIIIEQYHAGGVKEPAEAIAKLNGEIQNAITHIDEGAFDSTGWLRVAGPNQEVAKAVWELGRDVLAVSYLGPRGDGEGVAYVTVKARDVGDVIRCGNLVCAHEGVSVRDWRFCC